MVRADRKCSWNAVAAILSLHGSRWLDGYSGENGRRRWKEDTSAVLDDRQENMAVTN